jgi:hypothetical protein
MANKPTMDPNALISHLNAIDQPELADKLGEAVDALDRIDLKTYRRRVETVVAKLGHLR